MRALQSTFVALHDGSFAAPGASITVEIAADEGTVLTLITMLVTTNDGSGRHEPLHAGAPRGWQGTGIFLSYNPGDSNLQASTASMNAAPSPGLSRSKYAAASENSGWASRRTETLSISRSDRDTPATSPPARTST